MTTEALTSIQWLFGKLGAAYGAAWERSLGTTPIKDVQAEWNKRLMGFTAGDIRYALDHLSAKPPNVFEFRDLCRASPKKETLLLEEPPANPERMKAALTELRSALGQSVQRDPKQWAHDIVSDLEAGKRVPAYRVEAARVALGIKGRQPWQ